MVIMVRHWLLMSRRLMLGRRLIYRWLLLVILYEISGLVLVLVYQALNGLVVQGEIVLKNMIILAYHA
jgi:uncharacterized membrane protein